jgi:hypothetical protein
MREWMGDVTLELRLRRAELLHGRFHARSVLLPAPSSICGAQALDCRASAGDTTRDPFL